MCDVSQLFLVCQRNEDEKKVDVEGKECWHQEVFHLEGGKKVL